MSLSLIEKELKKQSSKKKAKVLQSFFKTSPGEYGAKDLFIGVTVPQIRKLAQKYQNLDLKKTIQLLKSPIHEQRLLGLLILVLKYEGGSEREKKEIYKIYLKNTKQINNWDLVDLTAPRIVGAYLADKSKLKLYTLAKSKVLWERRISIVATFYFIRRSQYKETLNIAALLLGDKHDLIHKACGWMLREVGKRDQIKEERFLKKYYRNIPRTTLRYAIERFPKKKRKAYLKGNKLTKDISGLK